MNILAQILNITNNTFFLLIGGFFVWILKRERSKRNSIERQLSPTKHKIYTKLISDIFIILSSRTPHGSLFTETSINLMEKHKDLIPYASDEVLSTLYELISIMESAKGILEEELYVYCGKLIYYIRKDMGHKNKGVKVEDVITALYSQTNAVCEASPEKARNLEVILRMV